MGYVINMSDKILQWIMIIKRYGHMRGHFFASSSQVHSLICEVSRKRFSLLSAKKTKKTERLEDHNRI